MLEKIFIGLIVALAVFSLVRRYWWTIKGSNSGCGCGCSGCPSGGITPAAGGKPCLPMADGDQSAKDRRP
jgi:hypothetical protein